MASTTTPNVPLKDRLRQLMIDYGSMALWVYFGLFVAVLIGFAIATVGFFVWVAVLWKKH